MLSKIKVADEVWVATAGLHLENPEVEDFTAGQIVERVLENDYFGRLRPGISIHVSQHCVADKPANPGNYLMLASSPGPGGRRRRLFRDGDEVGIGRENGKRVPYLSEIPFEQQDEVKRLLEWWSMQEGGYPFSESGNPKIGTTPVKVRLNQIRLSDDIYPFFRSHPELGSINDIRDLGIAEHDSEGNPTDRYRHRQVSIKVGYALKVIEENGLLKRFEEVLSETNRTIKRSYLSRYHENEYQLNNSSLVNNGRDNFESSEVERKPYRGVYQSGIRRPLFGAEPGLQNTRPGSDFTIEYVTTKQIHLQKDIRQFLDIYSPETAPLAADDAPLAISEHDEYGDPTTYYKDRAVTIRVGFLIATIRKMGLIGEFDDLLSASGRTLDPRYEQMYQQNMAAIAASSEP